MIIVKLSGGLGNQMFQYSFALNLATKNSEKLKIDATVYKNNCNGSNDTPRGFDLDKFNISSPLANSNEIKKIKYPLGLFSKVNRFLQQKILRTYHLDVYSLNNKLKKDTYLDGYFQSEKNFTENSSLVRKEFSIKKEFLSEHVQEISTKINQCESISIHIRRGDYAQDEKTNKYHGLCSLSYYEGAISLITSKVKNPHFFIFSDDLEWVKKNLPINHPHTFVSDGVLIPQQEMYLMSKCKHNIIANSTFSWWGAWLNENPDKIVIAPKKWVNIEPNPHPNIIPETWITI